VTSGAKILGCDTVYAVNKEHFAKTWIEITQLDQLLQIVDTYDLPPKVDIVLTGGEPLLNYDDKNLVEFLKTYQTTKYNLLRTKYKRQFF